VSNIAQRTITGVVLLGLIIGSIVFSEYSFLLCIGALLLFTITEFYTITKSDETVPQNIFGAAIGIAVFASSYLFAKKLVDARVFALIIPLFLISFIIELYKKQGKPFQNLAFTLLGIFYIALPYSLFNFIVFNHFNTEYSFGLLLCLFAFNWTNDTGAYIFGISFGKHRLFERISPKKSWEGAVGGAISVVGIAFLFAHLIPSISTVNWIILGLLVCVFGVFGDLVESLLKRSLNIKDSGTLLPGHGGFLDRFDAVIFSTPAFFAYLYLIS
jgi:phosphatidate cytidylyltransferase